MNDIKKRNRPLTLAEDELLAIAVQKYPCLYDKSHPTHKERNVVENAWDAVANELNFVKDGKNFWCYRYLFYCIFKFTHFPFFNRRNILVRYR